MCVLLPPVDVAVPILIGEGILQPIKAFIRQYDSTAQEIVSRSNDVRDPLLLGLGRVPQLFSTIDISMIGVEGVPCEGLLRLLTVRYHLSSSNFSDRLPDAVRQAHRVRPRLLEGLLAHADALVVHG